MNTLAETYEGNFLKAEDLPEGALVSVRIVEVVPPKTERDSQKRLITKAILRFKGKQKRLILNKTNYDVLKAMFGIDGAWIEKEIHIQRRYLAAKQTVNKQANQPCVRIIPPIGTPIPKNAFDFMGSVKPE